MIIEFTVPGKPKPQGRPRVFSRRKMRPIAVDPSHAAKEDFLVLAYQHAPSAPLQCPLQLVCRFTLPRPKAHYTKKGMRDTAPIRHTSRPDLDNMVKFITDALNGVFYTDDSLLCEVIATKVYGESPSTYVRLKQVHHQSHGLLPL